MPQITRSRANHPTRQVPALAQNQKKGAMAARTIKQKFDRFIKYWIPVIFCGIIIFLISAIPASRMPNVFRYQDVVGHLVEYTLFGFLWVRAFKEYYPRQSFTRRLIWIFIFVLIYAALDELHQLFVPGRVASWNDIGIDMIGILLANLIVYDKDPAI